MRSVPFVILRLDLHRTPTKSDRCFWPVEVIHPVELLLVDLLVAVLPALALKQPMVCEVLDRLWS